MDLHIDPHRGIGPVSFGMTRDEVIREMRHTPTIKNPETICFFGSSFQVSFIDDVVAFIEVSSAISETIYFEGIDVFDTLADNLLATIERHDTADAALSRPPNQFVFANLILTLWGRSAQYDHRGGRTRPVFAAVGIGSDAYLKSIQLLKP